MKFIVKTISLLFLISCTENNDFENEVIVSFSNGSKHYGTYEEIKGEENITVSFILYTVPDSLAKFYAYRDSVIDAAVSGDKESWDFMVKSGFNTDTSIEEQKFTVIKRYTLTVPSDLYLHSYKKMIWDKDGGNSVYLPNLDLIAKF